MFDSATINENRAYTLAECLSYSVSEEENCEDFSTQIDDIKAHFRECLYLCDNEQLAFIHFVAEYQSYCGSCASRNSFALSLFD